MESNHSEEGRRPNSALITANSESGIFRRAKSTPSLPESEEEESGRRNLWGWGQRPNLPPPHFYYLPHTPPRNMELKHEDIPEGPDRVKRIKERIEGESLRITPTEEAPRLGDGRTKNCTSEETPKMKKTTEQNGTPFPYRTPSFGGSMVHINKCSTLPHRSSSSAVRKTTKIGPESSPSWRSTLPRNGVSDMYWNGISTIAKGNKNKLSPEKFQENGKAVPSLEDAGEVRVSSSTLERIRARGSSVTYYGGRVVKQGSPADPTHVIMEEIRKQREQEEDVGLVEDLNGALKALGRHEFDWSEGKEKQDSSYGSADSTPVGTPGPSVAPTPPPPPSPRPLSPQVAKVVSTVAKKGDDHLLHPSWSGKCSVVFDFRSGKESGRGRMWEGERGRDGAWEDG
ncbi:hypothetical protein J437_LFUL008720, partial [Ladona fulva]